MSEKLLLPLSDRVVSGSFLDSLGARVMRVTMPRRVSLIIAVAFFSLIGAFDVFGRVAHPGPFLSAVDFSGRVGFAAGPSFVGLPQNPLAVSAPAASEAIVPARLSIPSIGVDATVQNVGVNAEGAMQAPSGLSAVGWFRYGSRPGAQGNAVFDGHVNNALSSAGVFERLGQISLGDRVVVSDASGRTLTFVVRSEQLYPADNAPLERIFSTTGPPQLVLITCDGAWDSSTRTYTKRLVVIASLVNE